MISRKTKMPTLRHAAAAGQVASPLHDRVLVLDSHVDAPLDLGIGPHEAAVDGGGQVDLPKLERGQVDAVAPAMFVPQGPRTPEGKATVFLVGHPAKGGEINFTGLNAAWSQRFGTADQPNKPARSTVKVAGRVAPGALVEIEVVAARAH
jgi:hypothetical protein